ncbi:cell division/cell wall cluster transcriptional repressor MraZ [Candidatus Uhrbacteria bacterium RIFCSPHIGHO2_12_FULL_57_11]|uniref:Transcriptional regulator MraZ n=2 Tax=Candidatus Uhriibacteriota TaxID=1752732 RepID=A0A1F7UNV6_9BACT|nr:MAG: cell division/cell wall cluster transcriptional repressor MraZ [Candidatus Uhrbacteria bacterium RIFCSPHIGHO2_02_FULL_57_19]OGL79388.1 MAG: cell division/cell wall cluster transcriptional repressor MraZ [Candidatus Uhrbacteria bacterium RIFCSPHIGHO2_12_FULL_57_11]
MFIGEYHHVIDEKGRLAVPVKFRARLSKGCVVTRGLDACLWLVPEEEWQKLAGKLAGLPIAQANARAFARFMLSGALDATPDKQGRVMVPEYLREYAKLEKQVVVAGLYSRLEIWDKTAWEKYRKGTEASSGEIAEQLGALGV